MASPSSTGNGLGVPDDDELRAEVAAVLASEDFRRSPKISRLFRYICDKQINGQAAEITEYGIALEALGRDAQFDPQQDAVVRVDLHHLRKKLNKYYAGEGAGHPIQIAIPNGQYAPLFVKSEASEAPVEPAEARAARTATAGGKIAVGQVEVVSGTDPRSRGRDLGHAARPAKPRKTHTGCSAGG